MILEADNLKFMELKYPKDKRVKTDFTSRTIRKTRSGEEFGVSQNIIGNLLLVMKEKSSCQPNGNYSKRISWKK